jgi:peroxiredoxin (alkyl hydroperoxide reductase subunit C)
MQQEQAATEQPVGLPRLGSPAPKFQAKTTHGVLKLEDFKGGWLILFSHPADFTPVCTTEFIGFAEIYPELQKLNTQLLGLSVDSVYSHIAWVRNIEEKMGVKIQFPVIADLDMKVAKSYGMIHDGESNTEASRAVFIIDDKQILRAMIYYPLSTGRNMDEVLRLVMALQTSDANSVATPANWRPGDKVIIPPASTQEMAEERVKDTSLECTDWYFCKKTLQGV